MSITVIRAVRVKLLPTEDQKILINRFIGLSRYVYNWTIDEINKIYSDTGLFTHKWDMNKRFKEYRDLVPNDDPIKILPLNTANRAINSASKAFELFFKKKTKYPKYKTKKNEIKTNALSFSVRGQRLKFHEDGVSIEGFGYGNHIKYEAPNILPIGQNSSYYNCTVVNDKETYWLIVNVKLKVPIIIESVSDKVIGIDVGLHSLAVLSNGVIYKSPDISKFAKRYNRQSSRVQRDIYRRVNLSKSTKLKYEDIEKTKGEIQREKELQKTVRKISNIQNSYTHKISKEIVETYPKAIVMENLNISEMVLKKRRGWKGSAFSQSIYRARLYTFRKQVQYKAYERGIEVVLADKYYPSSQICSNCGNIHKTSDRVYKCSVCGIEIDRDLNAALNLRDYYFKRT